jgi:hypothetical protein
MISLLFSVYVCISLRTSAHLLCRTNRRLASAGGCKLFSQLTQHIMLHRDKECPATFNHVNESVN